jgi:hypothetical protein
MIHAAPALLGNDASMRQPAMAAARISTLRKGDNQQTARAATSLNRFRGATLHGVLCLATCF